jgi:hypothetical protein
VNTRSSSQISLSLARSVADQCTHVSPVLLLHMSTVITVACPGPGEGDLIAHAVVKQVVVD